MLYALDILNIDTLFFKHQPSHHQLITDQSLSGHVSVQQWSVLARDTSGVCGGNHIAFNLMLAHGTELA